jgi:hypothetical protein
MSKVFVCLLAGAALALPSPVARAAAKKRVEVAFVMPDKKYVRAFRPERIDELLAGAAAAIAEELAGAIRFLEFTTTGPAAYQLEFRLDRADPRVTGTDDEFGFHVTLTGEGIRKAQQTYWVFRSAERYGDRIGTHEELIKEIRLNVAHDSNVAQLVGKVLHEAAFTEEADFRTEEPVGWVLKHYSRDDLCLDVDSRLEVRSRYRVGRGKKSTDFRAIVLPARGHSSRAGIRRRVRAFLPDGRGRFA